MTEGGVAGRIDLAFLQPFNPISDPTSLISDEKAGKIALKCIWQL